MEKSGRCVWENATIETVQLRMDLSRILVLLGITQTQEVGDVAISTVISGTYRNVG